MSLIVSQVGSTAVQNCALASTRSHMNLCAESLRVGPSHGRESPLLVLSGAPPTPPPPRGKPVSLGTGVDERSKERCGPGEISHLPGDLARVLRITQHVDGCGVAADGGGGTSRADSEARGSDRVAIAAGGAHIGSGGAVAPQRLPAETCRGANSGAQAVDAQTRRRGTQRRDGGAGGRQAEPGDHRRARVSPFEGEDSSGGELSGRPGGMEVGLGRYGRTRVCASASIRSSAPLC